MARGNDAASGLGGDITHTGGIARRPGLCAVRGARRQFAVPAVAQVGLQFRGCGRDRGAARLALFQRPLLLGAINQAQIVDARIHLRGRARAHEVGYGDGGQQTDNRDDDHNFNEGETCLAADFIFHKTFFLSYAA